MIRAYCDKCGNELVGVDAAESTKFVSLADVDWDSFEVEGTTECLGMFCGNCLQDVRRVLKRQSQP